MRKNVIIGLIASAMLVFGTTAASALTLTASFNLANSVFANSVTVNGLGDIDVALTSGDIIAMNVTVANAPADDITAIFASVTYDATQLTFLGGAFSNVLTESSCVGFLCSPATLAAGIPNPIVKPNSPDVLATGITGWVQALAHANVNGTTGTGPDSGVLFAFQYTGLGGDDFVGLGMALTQGDVIGSTNGLPFTGTLTLTGATVNIPEPGTALLMGLGLLGLGAAGRRKS